MSAPMKDNECAILEQKDVQLNCVTSQLNTSLKAFYGIFQCIVEGTAMADNKWPTGDWSAC